MKGIFMRICTKLSLVATLVLIASFAIPQGVFAQNGRIVSAAPLQDENNFFLDLQNRDLPAVSFIKPIGPNNEHPGYADLLQGH
jgi:hypothetical protein